MAQLSLRLTPPSHEPHPSFHRRIIESIIASDGVTTLSLRWVEGFTAYTVKHARSTIHIGFEYDYALAVYDDVRKAS